MTTLLAAAALTPEGWRENARIVIGADGTVASVSDRAVGDDDDGAIGVDVLLPAPVNLHSHAFQRAMSGLAERRGPDARDSFWTWRDLMYRFVGRLDPDDVEAIAAFVQMETLEAGFGAIAEFHYLHHAPDGRPYADPGELSGRIAAAAATTGIGLTLLPVLYTVGGCDGRPLEGGQRRFGNGARGFERVFASAGRAVGELAADARLGVAPHSLRAVTPEGLAFAAALAPRAPLHLHVAEQPAEVAEVVAARGARPVEWLLGHHEVDERWCLIHATHVTADESRRLARSGAVAGLCPITESSLGDGIFDAPRFVEAGGRFGVGSDSNLRISLAEELRTLEHSQRLRDGARNVLADAARSTGRRLFDEACLGGARAAGRASGRVEVGAIADLVGLDGEHVALLGRVGDALLDGFVFSGGETAVRDVWSAGRHVVRGGVHVRRPAIEAAYRRALVPLVTLA